MDLLKNKMTRKKLFNPGHTSCAGCGPAIALKIIAEAVGKNTILVITTGCMEVTTTAYGRSAWNLPIIHSAIENAGATCSGIEAAMKQKGKKVNIVAIAGDGATFDIGLQSLSGMLERKHKVLFICYDNEGYQNTGIQRSSATPLYAETTTTPYGKNQKGNIIEKKDMPFIVASHKGVYVATANISRHEDFKKKIKKALDFNGPSYIQVLAPCVPGWKISPSETIKVSKLAIESGIAPLYEIEEGKIILKEEKKIPVIEYLKQQGRFKNLTAKEIEEIQKKVDENYNKLKTLSELKIRIF